MRLMESCFFPYVTSLSYNLTDWLKATRLLRSRGKGEKDRRKRENRNWPLNVKLIETFQRQTLEWTLTKSTKHFGRVSVVILVS